MIIKPIRRYGAYGLCVLCVVFQPHLLKQSVAAESVLQNKRLFFTESQRSGMSEEPTSTIAAVVSNPRVDLTSIEVVPAVNNEVIQREDQRSVRFTGVVAGVKTVVLLINGLPCKAIEHYLLVGTGTGTSVVSLDCPHIERALTQLSWLPAEQQLIVNKKGNEVARLYVGQSV